MENSMLEKVMNCSEIELLQSDMLLDELRNFLNELIQSDFTKLVQLLYRIDISEMKLKQILKDNPQSDAGLLIAQMIIERQIKKIRFRKEMESKKVEDGGEERW
jgi:hypothetical protein